MVWPHRLVVLLIIPAVLVVGGTAGYYFIEPDYSLFDALYMTVITLTTVGYAEVHPLSTGGRLFTMVLLLVGVFTLFFAATEVIRAVVGGEVQDLLGRRLMAKQLAGVKDHIIICGFGRMGRFICQEFSRNGVPFVIIDRKEESLAGLDLPLGIALPGDATSDDVLRMAGVDRARALVAAAASDADNLYITMSARLLNDKLFIISRAEGEPAEHKLVRAGANRVIAPYAISGSRVANAVLRPNVVDFLELAFRAEFNDLQIEEIEILGASRLSGATLKESRLRDEFGVIIVAIKKSGSAMLFNPPGDARMESGDTLIALGPLKQIALVAELAKGKTA